MAGTNISVGFFISEKDKNMVGVTIDNKSIGLSPALARHLAVDLMIWADRLDPTQTAVENQSLTD